MDPHHSSSPPRRDLDFVLDREGADHTIYKLDGMVEAMSRYTAHATRDGRFWLVHVPEVDRSTQARSIAAIEVMARDLVAIMEGVVSDSFELDVRIVMPGSLCGIRGSCWVCRISGRIS